MNITNVTKAIDAITEGLNLIKKEINGESASQINEVKEEGIDTERLAHRMACSYTTMHPEFRIESQFRNLKDMINGPKITFVLSWIKRGGIEGLENFFKLNEEEQRKEMKKALEEYEDKIKAVFTKRFVQ